MLANQVLNKIIGDIQNIIRVDCSVWSMQGKCLATAGQNSVRIEEAVNSFLEDRGEQEEQVNEQEALFLIQDSFEAVYILAIHESVANVEIMGKLCVSQFENLIQAYKEKLDRNRFFQNLVLDNMLLVDIFNQAKKLRIDIERRRVVFLVEPKQEEDSIVIETLKGLYATGTKDFVTSVDEGNIILIKSVEKTEDYKDLKEIAKAIVDTLNAEAMVDVRVAYGTIVTELKDVSKSYKEAGIALDVGRIFYAPESVLAYNQLGIGRLIHQLPVSLCEMFLREVFDDKDEDQFDEETLSTVNQFFENNLNISETARQLYIHRNTLVYRLEKIQKTTGLDVRVFDDALTFKIALMVASHMKFLQSRGKGTIIEKSKQEGL